MGASLLLVAFGAALIPASSAATSDRCVSVARPDVVLVINIGADASDLTRRLETELPSGFELEAFSIEADACPPEQRVVCWVRTALENATSPSSAVGVMIVNASISGAELRLDGLFVDLRAARESLDLSLEAPSPSLERKLFERSTPLGPTTRSLEADGPEDGVGFLSPLTRLLTPSLRGILWLDLVEPLVDLRIEGRRVELPANAVTSCVSGLTLGPHEIEWLTAREGHQRAEVIVEPTVASRLRIGRSAPEVPSIWPELVLGGGLLAAGLTVGLLGAASGSSVACVAREPGACPSSLPPGVGLEPGSGLIADTDGAPPAVWLGAGLGAFGASILAQALLDGRADGWDWLWMSAVGVAAGGATFLISR
jgi:hypothetical protein